MPSGRHGFIWFCKTGVNPDLHFWDNPPAVHACAVRDGRYKDSNAGVYRFRIGRWWGGKHWGLFVPASRIRIIKYTYIHRSAYVHQNHQHHGRSIRAVKKSQEQRNDQFLRSNRQVLSGQEKIIRCASRIGGLYRPCKEHRERIKRDAENKDAKRKVLNNAHCRYLVYCRPDEK